MWRLIVGRGCGCARGGRDICDRHADQHANRDAHLYTHSHEHSNRDEYAKRDPNGHVDVYADANANPLADTAAIEH